MSQSRQTTLLERGATLAYSLAAVMSAFSMTYAAGDWIGAESEVTAAFAPLFGGFAFVFTQYEMGKKVEREQLDEQIREDQNEELKRTRATVSKLALQAEKRLAKDKSISFEQKNQNLDSALIGLSDADRRKKVTEIRAAECRQEAVNYRENLTKLKTALEESKKHLEPQTQHNKTIEDKVSEQSEEKTHSDNSRKKQLGAIMISTGPSFINVTSTLYCAMRAGYDLSSTTMPPFTLWSIGVPASGGLVAALVSAHLANKEWHKDQNKKESYQICKAARTNLNKDFDTLSALLKETAPNKKNEINIGVKQKPKPKTEDRARNKVKDKEESLTFSTIMPGMPGENSTSAAPNTGPSFIKIDSVVPEVKIDILLNTSLPMLNKAPTLFKQKRVAPLSQGTPKRPTYLNPLKAR